MKKRVSIMWLTIVPMVVLGLMAILTNMFSMKNISKVNTSGKQLANEHIVRITKLSEIENQIQTIHTYALSHVVATTFDTRVEMVAKIREETGSLDVTLDEYKEIMAPEDAMAYEQLCESYEQLKLEINQLMAYSANDEADQAYGMVNGIIQEHSHAMKENIESMIGNTKTAASDATEELGHVYTSARMNTIVVIFVIIGCVCVSLFLVVYRFFKPLRKANKEINLIIESIDRSEGDLTRRIEIDANNEISDFANAVNTFLEKLQSIMKSIINNTVSMGRVISEVQESVRTSNDGVSDLSAVTEELAATMQEIGKSAGMINTNTSTVRTDVEMIAAKSNEINSYAKDMKLNANEMEENARNNMKETDIKVKDILEILNQAIEESKSVDQVNSLTNEILSISSQTNLLALNASIEAARAGEAGKGFAVVADEIRQLADSSRDTANRIQEINSVVTNAVHNLAGHANNLVEYMNDSILPEFSNFVESGEHYKENANYIENVMNEFANKTDSLKQEMDEIANSINTITSAIEEGANGVNGAAESTQQLVEDMEVISKKMDENATIEEDLKNETAIFTNF